jgi:hypothetical protein
MITLYGVRHHGPGSARSLREALSTQRPDVILIEGPPEADSLLDLANDPEMRPPVALVATVDRQSVPGEPPPTTPAHSTSAFWPFAVFSPEWQAITYALESGIPARFCDLPAANQLAMKRERARTADPIAQLATIAGYDDPERWWEDAVEHGAFAPAASAALGATAEHVPAPQAFAAIAEAIGLLRAGEVAEDREREAYMRKTLRKALKDGYTNIAVVCGAWHVPALTDLPPATHDDQILRGLPKVKPVFTWIPWSYGRLSFASGYGAGITSPGWYHHLFECGSFESRSQPIERWLAKAAAVLRASDIPASPAHVVESVRLANALAALRGRPLPGLAEVTEATRAVLCEGSDLLTELIQRELVIADRLGQIPPHTPMVPLQRDLRGQQRTLRLRPDPVPKDLDLDLRKPTDLGRSRLLHRLTLLNVDWGVPAPGRNSTGTFRESWQLQWRPELDLALIQAATWGPTVETAAVARSRSAAKETSALADLASLTERCLVADLREVLPEVLAAVRDRAALDADVTHLMDALPALARAARYGDVRGTDPAQLTAVAADLLTRVCTGFPAAVVSLDADSERAVATRIDAVTSAVSLLGDPTGRSRWLRTLSRAAERCPPLVAGRITRLLLDAGELDSSEVSLRMSRALSPGVAPASAAGWAEGFLAGSGLLLVHDERLLALVDGWLAGLTEEAFGVALPALRRTFGEFAPPERRAIGEQAARLAGTGQVRPVTRDLFDERRAERAVATVEMILGV